MEVRTAIFFAAAVALAGLGCIVGKPIRLLEVEPTQEPRATESELVVSNDSFFVCFIIYNSRTKSLYKINRSSGVRICSGPRNFFRVLLA